MKTNQLIWVFVVLFMAMLLVTSAFTAIDDTEDQINGQMYLGEFCWLVTANHRPDYELRLGISHMGGGHFSVQSKSDILQGDHYEASFGMLEIFNDQLIISLNSIHSDTEPPIDDADNIQWQFRLDPNSLQGTGWGLDTYYNPYNSQFGHDYHQISLTYSVEDSNSLVDDLSETLKQFSKTH